MSLLQTSFHSLLTLVTTSLVSLNSFLLHLPYLLHSLLSLVTSTSFLSLNSLLLPIPYSSFLLHSFCLHLYLNLLNSEIISNQGPLKEDQFGRLHPYCFQPPQKITFFSRLHKTYLHQLERN